MRSKWLTLSLGAVAGVALIAAACGPAAEPSATATPRPANTPAPGSTPGGSETSVSGIPLDPNAKFGGVLVVATTQEGPTTSPWEEAAGVAPSAVHPLTNSLIQHQTWGTEQDFLDGAYDNLHPDLATDWEQSADGLSWTFNLRDGVKWSDGEPFTCADAKWSFDTIRTGEGLMRSPRAVHLIAIEEIVCTDDLTMVVNLSRPKASLPSMLAMPYNSIFPEHVYAQDTDKLRSDPYKVGTGPFTLVEWFAGERYTFERNDEYWDQPFPYLDGLELQIVPAASMVTAQRGGRIDFYGQYTGGQADTLVRECTNCQFFPQYVHTGFTTLVVNHLREPFNDPQVMNAISLAVDRTKMVQIGAQGWGEEPTGGLFPSSSTWALPYERTRQIPGMDIDDPAANREQARQILADLGYAPGELTIPLTYWNQPTSVALYAVPLIEDLQAAGFSVTQTPLETARAYDAMTAADFAVHLHGFWVSDSEPDAVLYEYFYPGSDRNYGRYENPEVTRLIDEQSTTIDPTERLARVHDLQEMIMLDNPQYFLMWGAYQPIWSSRTQGIMPGNNASWNYGTVRRHAHSWIQ